MANQEGAGEGFPAMDEKSFARFSSFIEGELGIRMPPTKRIMLESRLGKRLRALRMASYAEYADYVLPPRGEAAELRLMIDAVTTNKTDFFREPDHFDYLASAILPAFMERHSARPFEIWSAGCASGEEPYTMAMVLEEARASFPRLAYRILATDISSRVLEAAAEAVYDAKKVEGISLALKRKYLLKSRDKAADTVRIKPELRAMVRFARVNLMDDNLGIQDSFDVVFCRNVIIYFDRPTQMRILTRICERIREGGYLMLGHSETLMGMDLPLKMVAPTIYRHL